MKNVYFLLSNASPIFFFFYVQSFKFNSASFISSQLREKKNSSSDEFLSEFVRLNESVFVIIFEGNEYLISIKMHISNK